MSEKMYLTKRVMSQKIGFVKSTVNDLKEIKKIISLVTHVDFSTAIFIRRSLEVYRDYLEALQRNEDLGKEVKFIKNTTGKRGRPLSNPAKPSH